MRARAFTLTEVLIVVAIIAVLSTVGINQYGIAQKRANDTGRKETLGQFRIALEAYRSKEGNYYVHDFLGGKPCSVSSGPAAEGYAMIGTGTGCVGLHGSGQGDMNRARETAPSNYGQSTTIAEALVHDGLLTTVRNDPLSPTYGFYLTLCQDNSEAATAPRNALNYALLAHSEINNTLDADQAARSCGGAKTPSGGWNLFSGG